MGHLGHLHEEYEELVERLKAGQVGYPRPEDPTARAGWQEILEILFTPQEAHLASKMPVRPARTKTVAKRFGLSEAEAVRHLEAMADKGVVADIIHPKTGEVRWSLAPPIVGFLEFSLMRAEGQDAIPKRRMAEALDAYMHGDDTFVREAFGGDTVVGRALVHESVFDDDQLPDVLGWERATALIEEAWNLGVSICYCRHKAEHLGHRCEAPLELCLSINRGADLIVRRGFGRKIEKAEALELLAAAREQRLVQIADNVVKRPSFICNCCGCCCGQLQAINEFDLPAVNPSGFEAVPSHDRCKGCGKCARACPIKAITMVPQRVTAQAKNRLMPQVDRERCIGCGVCADECRRRDIKMEARATRTHVPADSMERIVRMAIERGKLPHFLFDQGASRSARFLNQVVQVLSDLPPAQRALASEQVRSRFVRFVLGRP